MQENQENNIEKKEEIILNTSNEHTSAGVSVEETAKIVHNKREKNKFLRIIIISGIGFIILFVSAFLLFRYFKGLKEFTYNDEYPLYQYFAGGKTVYTGKITLSKEDDITLIENDEGIEDIEDVPIYFQNVDNEVLTSKNMLYAIPSINNKNYRINAFSKIVYEEDSKLTYYLLGKKKVLFDEGFLFDGANLYLFLSDVSIVIDEKNYELSALSYVIVNYKDQIEIYNKKLDEYTLIETHKNDVIATLGNHKINMSVDMVNNNRLLLKSCDNLPIYSEMNK